jgi:hypothetical protein
MKLRYFYPLLGFALPTLVIAYGIVIPRSCIAGINEQSLGFGTTILGACITYIAGIRAVLRSRPRKRPNGKGDAAS